MHTRGRRGHRGAYHGGGRFGLPPSEWFQPQLNQVSTGISPPGNLNEGQHQPAMDLARNDRGGHGGNMFGMAPGQQQPAMNGDGNMFEKPPHGNLRDGNIFAALANAGQQQPAGQFMQPPPNAITSTMSPRPDEGQQQPAIDTAGAHTTGTHRPNKLGDLGNSSWATPFQATPNPPLDPSRRREASLQADITNQLRSTIISVPIPGPDNDYRETAEMKLFSVDPSPTPYNNDSGPVDAESEIGSWHSSDEEGGDTLSLPSVKCIARPMPLPPQPNQSPPKMVPFKVNYTLLKQSIFRSCDPKEAGLIAQGILIFAGIHVCKICNKARDQAYHEAHTLERMTISMETACEKCQEKSDAEAYRTQWIEQQQGNPAQVGPSIADGLPVSWTPIWGNDVWGPDYETQCKNWTNASAVGDDVWTGSQAAETNGAWGDDVWGPECDTERQKWLDGYATEYSAHSGGNN